MNIQCDIMAVAACRGGRTDMQRLEDHDCASERPYQLFWPPQEPCSDISGDAPCLRLCPSDPDHMLF